MESPETSTRRFVKINKTDIAYSAAMLDAEGHVSGCWKDKEQHHIELVVVPATNCDLTMLKWLQSLWGGRINRKPMSRGRPCYRLKLRNNEAIRFLKLTKQFLRIKRPQAECALAYLSLPDKAPTKRRNLISRIQQLNQQNKIQSN